MGTEDTLIITPPDGWPVNTNRNKPFDVKTSEGIILDQYRIDFKLVNWNPAAPTIIDDAAIDGDPTTFSSVAQTTYTVDKD